MIKLERAASLRGTMCVPGDKSISHRSIMLGAIAEGETHVRGFLKSADCLATIDCFRRMGVEIEERIGDRSHFSDAGEEEPILIVHGRGLRGLRDPGGTLDAKNSGTTVRLLTGILAGQDFVTTITGDESLKKRPMGRIIRPLSYMGVMCATVAGDEKLPMTIFGGDVHSIRYENHIASAQVKSCVLLAGLYASEPTFYTEPSLSRNHTELMLGAFGGNLKVREHRDGSGVTTILYPGTILEGQDVVVPGDISSAAYFLAAALIIPGSRITVRGVGINETRDGILRVIRSMGGDLEVSHIRMEGRESVADITASYSPLRATKIGGAIIPALIDEIPILAVLAACADGITTISDVGELRVKESDRLTGIISNLRLMGINVDETEDGMQIHGGFLHGAKIDPQGDHRMAMAFTIAGLAASGTTIITDESCVNISYPSFYDDLARLE